MQFVGLVPPTLTPLLHLLNLNLNINVVRLVVVLLGAWAGLTVGQAVDNSTTTHVVRVGDSGGDGGKVLAFNPSTVYARPNDTVQFVFYPQVCEI